MQLSNLKFDLPAPGKYNDENAFQLEMNFHRNSPQPVFIVQLGGILLLTKPNSMQVISTWGVVILRSIWSSWFEQKLRCFITEKRAERSLVQPILYRLMHVFEWLPIILKSLVNVKWQMTIFFWSQYVFGNYCDGRALDSWKLSVVYYWNLKFWKLALETLSLTAWILGFGNQWYSQISKS